MLVYALWYRTLNCPSVIVSEPTRAITCEAMVGAGGLEPHDDTTAAHTAAIARPPLRRNILRPVYPGVVSASVSGNGLTMSDRQLRLRLPSVDQVPPGFLRRASANVPRGATGRRVVPSQQWTALLMIWR